jgi:hypothetical protein
VVVRLPLDNGKLFILRVEIPNKVALKHVDGELGVSIGLSVLTFQTVGSIEESSNLSESYLLKNVVTPWMQPVL